MDSEKLLKVAQKYECTFCHYITCKKSSFEKHITTDKHKKMENGSKMVENGSEKLLKVALPYECNCGKMYKYDSGYYRHKKICKTVNSPTNEIVDKDQLILMLIKQNYDLIKDTSDMKNMMMKVIENGTNNTTNNNTIQTNSHNKAFNLQFFLNETCKDAMNINEFIDSIQLQLSDLEKMAGKNARLLQVFTPFNISNADYLYNNKILISHIQQRIL